MHYSSPKRWHLTAAILALGVAGICPAAQATLQFADGFAYNVGDLNGDGPPAGAPAGQTGWTTNTGNTQVAAGSLSYPGIVSSGNKATVFGNDDDASSAGLTLQGTAPNTIVWVGFLFSEASGGATPGGYAVVALGGNSPSGPGIGMLYNQNVYGIDNDTSPDTQGVTTTAVSTATTFFAAELNFTSGEIYLFLDPGTTSTPPISSAATSLAMSPAFQSGGFDSVSIAAGANSASFNIDSLRIGTTFADVVPEPSAGWFLAAAAVGGSLWRGLRVRRRTA